jgi:hypothetical protein
MAQAWHPLRRIVESRVVSYGSKFEVLLGTFGCGFSDTGLKFFRTCTYTALTMNLALQHNLRNTLILLVVREGLEPSTSAL